MSKADQDFISGVLVRLQRASGAWFSPRTESEVSACETLYRRGRVERRYIGDLLTGRAEFRSKDGAA